MLVYLNRSNGNIFVGCSKVFLVYWSVTGRQKTIVKRHPYAMSSGLIKDWLLNTSARFCLVNVFWKELKNCCCCTVLNVCVFNTVPCDEHPIQWETLGRDLFRNHFAKDERRGTLYIAFSIKNQLVNEEKFQIKYKEWQWYLVTKWFLVSCTLANPLFYGNSLNWMH